MPARSWGCGGHGAERLLVRAVPQVLLVLLALAPTAVAFAQGFGGGVGVASAQTQRGISPSSGEPALFADAYWRADGRWQVSLGAAKWAPQPGRASGEYTLTLSRSHRLDDDWAIAASASHSGPLGGQPARRVAYDELSFSLAWQGRAQLLVALSPNWTTTDRAGLVATRRTTTIELSWHEPLPDRWALDAGFGHYDLRAFDRPGYWFASAGVSRGFGPFLASVAYVSNRGVSPNVLPEVRRSRWLLSLWWSY